jgi:cytochrome c1
MDFWNLPSRHSAALAFRKYGLRVLLFLVLLRLLWILLSRLIQ